MIDRNPRLPGNVLTVVLRDNSPFYNLQERPTKRSVQVPLSEEQRTQIALRCTGAIGTSPIYEEIEQCFIEPAED